MSAGGNVSDSRNQLPSEGHQSSGTKCRLCGLMALVLWGLALACSLLVAVWAFDHIRILVLTCGLMMIDIASAALLSNWWFVGRRVIDPMTDYRIALRYGYEGGYADGYADGVFASDVSPVIPLSGRIVSANGSRNGVNGHVG